MKIAKFLKVAIASATLFGAMSASATIIGSKHDLTNTGNNIYSTSTDQLCVFCHTPHAANLAFTGAPLWNKANNEVVTYSTYQNTVAGNDADLTPNNPSLVCLSCHDGVNAINSVVNAPGSGDPFDYSQISTVGGDYGAGVSEGNTSASLFDMPDNIIPNIGDTNATNTDVDLTNDHPVSIIYSEGAASLRLKTTDLYMTTGVDINWTVQGTNVTAASQKEIVDLLRGAVGSEKIECVSCHDPHMGGNPTFLRVASNAESRLCITCHNK